MPLVPCPDCGREISPSAPSCPHCGRPNALAFAPTAVGVAPGPEKVVWEGVPSARALLGAIIATALYVGAVIAAVVLSYGPGLDWLGGTSPALRRSLAVNQAGVRLAAIAFVLTVCGQKLVRLGWQVLVLRSHRYRVTNQRIVIDSGVFSKRIEEIDMRNVEDIEFRQTFVQRLLGIGEITIVSADKTTGRYRLLGVERPREVREQIRQSAYGATRGQLFTRST